MNKFFLNRCDGNIFFLVLIAVALFAAVSFAVTQSSRSGNKDISSDQEELALNSFLSFASEIKVAVDRLVLSGRCSETALDFSNIYTVKTLSNSTMDSDLGAVIDISNSNAPADYSCHIFYPQGGGVSPRLIDKEILSSRSFNNTNYMHHRSYWPKVQAIDGVGTSEPDLLMVMGRMSKAACFKMNEKLGVENAGSYPPVDTMDDNRMERWGLAHNIYRGSFPATTEPIGNDSANLYGKLAFCFGTTAFPVANESQQAYFVQVLIAR